MIDGEGPPISAATTAAEYDRVLLSCSPPLWPGRAFKANFDSRRGSHSEGYYRQNAEKDAR